MTMSIDDRRAALEDRAASGLAADQYALASHLIANPTSHADFTRSIQLFEVAANAGNGAAMERCALFDAVGVMQPSNWERALDRLCRAAELGSDKAAGALAAIAPDDAGSMSPSDKQKRISVATLLRPPQPRDLSAVPLIRVFDGFASAAECNWLIEQARSRLAPATVYDSQANTHGTADARSNSSAPFNFADMDMVVELVRARMSSATGIPLPAFEAPQVLNYQVGQEFRPHVDFLEPSSPIFASELASRGQRAATFLIYLNDDFEGGATQFPRLNIDYRGSPGDAIMFANVGPSGAPDPNTLHAGLPPTRGEKWLFSQWIRDRMPG